MSTLKRFSRKNPRIIFYFSILVLTCGVLFFYQSPISGVNAHEHIQTMADAEKFLRIMDEFGIKKTVILGSPRQTFYPSSINGADFYGYDENNNAILEMGKKYPDRFVPFCVASQDDPEKTDKMRECAVKGATGVKLFSGHGTFHTILLDDPSLFSFYDFIYENDLIVLWHVNGGRYLSEFGRVLARYDGMKVICAHFCLLSNNLTALSSLLDSNRNLFVDMSFGSPDILEAGLKRISENNDEYRAFFKKYSNRILWGTDIVITKGKYPPRIRENIQVYRDLIEKKSFSYNGKTYNGLALSYSVLKKIYLSNYLKISSIP